MPRPTERGHVTTKLLYAFVVMFIGLLPLLNAAIAFVRQSSGTANPSAATVNVTITAPTNGNFLVGCFTADNSTPVFTAPTQTGATWHVGIVNNSAAAAGIVYSDQASSASTTVAINSTGNMTNLAWNISEYSGGGNPSVADGSGNKNNGAKNSTATTGSLTTLNAADLVFACLNSEAGTVTTNPPTSFTSLTVASGSGVASVGDYQVVASTGSFNPSWGNIGQAWSATIFALKASSAAFIAGPPLIVRTASKRAASYFAGVWEPLPIAVLTFQRRNQYLRASILALRQKFESGREFIRNLLGEKDYLEAGRELIHKLISEPESLLVERIAEWHA